MKAVVPDRSQPYSSGCSHENEYMSSTNLSKWVIVEKENKKRAQCWKGCGRKGVVVEELGIEFASSKHLKKKIQDTWFSYGGKEDLSNSFSSSPQI